MAADTATAPLSTSPTVDAPVTLRPPTVTTPASTTAAPSSSPAPPTLAWLQGVWHVTHSTLPMWKKSRNVQIRYDRIPDTAPPQLDDTVTYQELTGQKLKTVRGVDRPSTPPDNAAAGGGDGSDERTLASAAYTWRGNGLLAVATSRWEILGHGDEKSVGNRWVVTYFAKTVFTPAGIDILSRDKDGLRQESLSAIKAALAELGGDLAQLATDMFEVQIDNATQSAE